MPFSYGAFCSSWTKHPSPTTPKIRRLRNTGCWNGRVLSSFGMDHSPFFGAQDMSLIHWHCLDYGSYGLLKIMSTCCGKQSGCCINQARKGHLLSQCLRCKTQKEPQGRAGTNWIQLGANRQGARSEVHCQNMLTENLPHCCVVLSPYIMMSKNGCMLLAHYIPVYHDMILWMMCMCVWSPFQSCNNDTSET